MIVGLPIDFKNINCGNHSLLVLMEGMLIMTGQTYLILSDLKSGLSIHDVAQKFHKEESSIYKLAKRHKIELPQRQFLSDDEKRRRKQILDARRYSQKTLKRLLDPNTAMPALPMVAAKFGALSSLTTAWQLKQGFRRSSVAEGKAIQVKHGLKSLIGQ